MNRRIERLENAELVAALRDWSRESAAECEQSFRATGPTADSGVLDTMYRRFRALDTLLTARLDAERARLVAAVTEAEAWEREAGETFGTADHAAARLYERDRSTFPPTPEQRAHILSRQRETEEAAEEARRAVEAARRALAAFDTATKGGE